MILALTRWHRYNYRFTIYLSINDLNNTISQFQIVIPKAVREALRLVPEQKFHVLHYHGASS